MSIWYILLLVAEAILGLMMMALILLHAPKGEGLGGIGGGATMFTGKRGAEAGLDRLTWTISVLFMLVCFVLGFGLVR